MAGASSNPARLALGSYQTALCVVPPAHICRDIDRLRSSHDKAYGRWPAHVNLIYPFVTIESLPQAVDQIRSKLNTLADTEEDPGGFDMNFESTDSFSHRHNNTVFLAPIGFDHGLKRLRSFVLEALGQDAVLPSSPSDEEIYHPHLTIGQSSTEGAEYLMSKASFLLPLKWRVEELMILAREQPQIQDGTLVGEMRAWGVISLPKHGYCEFKQSLDLRSRPRTAEAKGSGGEGGRLSAPQAETTYRFSELASIWEPVRPPKPTAPDGSVQKQSTITISSYNVLVEPTFSPSSDRYPLLTRILVSEPALSDIVTLQEVSDAFLSHLLGQDSIRRRWPFVTHGPPDQEGIGPLASLRNIVVLSRWNFRWEWLPLERKHKGTPILIFEDIGIWNGLPSAHTAETRGPKTEVDFLPIVVAGVHLTSGLTDGAIAAKKSQLNAIVSYLSTAYPQNPWIIAGDFNLTTSTVTIREAIKSKSISPEAANTLSSLETLLSDARLSDSWFVARTETTSTFESSAQPKASEDTHDGEEGATFNPMENALAAEMAGSSLGNRPQRYDRILVKGEGLLKVTGFSMFGFPKEGAGPSDSESEDRESQSRYGSDHWGIRAALKIDPDLRTKQTTDIEKQLVSLEPTKAPRSLADIAVLKSCLAKHAMLPTESEIDLRREVFELLKRILQQSPPAQEPAAVHEAPPVMTAKPAIPLVIVPVGSYGLGVWNSGSDIDCLCVGSLSSKTFLTLARQRLRKAADLGVKVLRTVKAASGTMLELEIKGVKLDLQYCPATKIAESWAEVNKLPPSDPLFDLSISSLKKLNAFRDMDYLQQTIPDLAVFRLAHRFIKTWAQQRGIYSTRFGYLGGIHITLLLSRVCKLLFRDAGAITAADIICTFFKHYSKGFDWKSEMAFDPFFHTQRPRYQRSVAREPAVILSLHAPAINVAHAASSPSVRTLVEELKRTDRLIEEENITWLKLIDGEEEEGLSPALRSGALDFLKSYNSYIKIDVQYWGTSLAKGSSIIGLIRITDLNRKLPDIHARIWPARFTHTDNISSNDDGMDYHGCYLIGLAKGGKVGGNDTSTSEADRSAKRLAQEALRLALEGFTEMIRGDEKYYDARTTWVEVSHTKQTDLGGLGLDRRDWGTFAINDDSDTTSEDDNDADDTNEPELPAKSKSKSNPKSKNPAHSTPKPHKLRPAHEILHRLLWDPAMDASDHVVGYEDRFVGTREIPVERWKTESTDEEFIPMHRVMYFRRKSDGVKVWERGKVGSMDA
ncbi:MAG: hypothetical protein M1840_005102 [Geoglossum simile]|nr:MAG: hypothetical protein M1840_005102 [Geoglossum simile]